MRTFEDYIDDEIDSPEYYQGSSLTVIEVIENFGLNFNLGNCIKYLLRARKKTACPCADLKKALWYLLRELESVENTCGT